LSVAVEQRGFAVLLDALIGLAFDAIGIGDRIIHAIAPALSTVTAALIADGTDSLEAAAAARALFETAVLERVDLTAPPKHARATHLALQAARDRGLIDAIAIGEAAVSSAGAIRQALSRA